ncbi:MAG: TonB-dependent receptor [Chitinophagaceae bacterium]|nr:TonB-dependent receptor [Chitinophagaceae bacterium]
MKKKSCLLLFACLSFGIVFAQTREIKGTVLSAESNLPLAGASITVKGTSTTTLTDAEGRFRIFVSDNTPVLIISFKGFNSEEVSVRGKVLIEVKLNTEVKALDDVVVVGYSTIKRKDLTGSVSSVTAKQLKDVPLAATAQALQGRLAGVQISSTDGQPGAEMLIRVRGGGSITQDIAPLYIVDGVQVEDALSTLSLQDIASIDVLKDASTTAIYGARGANGVVIITTKNGTPGKSQVTYSGSMGFRKLPQYLDVMKPYDFVVWQWERSRGNNTDSTNFAQTYGTTWDTLNVYKDIDFINWQDKIFGRSAKFQNHNASVSGGNQSTTFNLSLTANNEEGIQLESGLKRYLVNFKLEHKVSDKLRAGITARYLDQVINGKGTIDPGTREASRMRHSINYRPFELPKPGYGEDEFDLTYQQNSRITNPILVTRSEYRKQYSKGTYFTGFLNYSILKNLVWRSTFGMDNVNIRTDQFWDKISSTASRFSNLPVAMIGQQQNNTLNNSNTLQYSLINFNNNHDITVLAGQEIVQIKSKQNTIETRYFPADIDAEKALANMGLGSVPSGSTAQQPMPTSFQATPQRIFSVFGRLTYAFKDRYLATFNIRSDRSSKFTPDNSLLVSPSGSVAWRISREKFMENISWISDAKIRFGYGQVGNNRIGDNLYRQLYGVTAAYSLNHSVLPGFVPTALANPDLEWEKNITRNFGLDLALFNNKLQFTMDIYKNSANNLLLNVKIPTTTGYTDQIQNVGSLTNSGIEFQIGATPVSKKDFTWSSNFNISFNKNRIDNLGGVDNILKTSGWQVGGEIDYVVKVGQPVGQMYGYITDGWYTVDDFNYNPTTQSYTLKAGVANNTTVFSSNPQPGMLKFKDLNGDGIVDDVNDKTIIGDANPKFTGGWNNQFTYKNFDLSLFVNFVYGNDIYNANKIEFTQGDFVNLNTLELNKYRWTNINSSGQVIKDPAELVKLNTNVRIWSPVRTQRWPLHTWAIEDGSFIRFSNVTLGYTLPKRLLNSLKITTFRLFATVNNLATITNYSGFDPDINTRRSDPLTPGVDFAGYPHSRVWTFGVNITF